MEPVQIPKAILSSLLRDETIIAAVMQSRLKYPVNPGVVAITNLRMFIYNPKLGGLKYDLAEAYYRDLENVSYHKGLLMGALTVLYVSGQKLTFGELNNEDGMIVAREATQKIRDAFLGRGEAVGKVLTQGQRVEFTGYQPSTPPTPEQDPIKVAKLRFANGLISKADLDDIIKALS